MSSTSSISSCYSSSSTEDESQAPTEVLMPNKQAEADLFQQFTGKRKAKKYCAQDKLVVNEPIMRVLDAMYLAPMESPLFKRHMVKRADLHGHRRLKKNKDVVVSLFKRLTKSTLRRLLRDETTKMEANLAQRYFYAALAVTTKRRANHIQSWRMFGHPLTMCYGGEEQYNAKYGNIKQERTKSKREVASEVTAKVVAEVVADPFSFTADFSGDETQDEAEDKAQDTLCAGCGESFPAQAMFPKSAKDFDEYSEMRCGPCWDVHMKAELLPKIVQQAVTTAHNKRNTDSLPPATQKRPCKCGSTTHQTSNSRECPRNKRYNKHSLPSPLSTTSVTTAKKRKAPDTTASSTKKRKGPDTTASSTTKKRKAPASTTSSTNKRKATTIAPIAEKTPDTPPANLFTVGSVVNARWSNGKYYRAMIIAAKDNKYTVYFIDDSEVIEDLAENKIRAPLMAPKFTRESLAGSTFFDDGQDFFVPGNWRVNCVNITDGTTYDCERLSGGEQIANCEIGEVREFDVGHVLRLVGYCLR